MRIEKILSIQVDGMYCQPPKGVREAFCKEIREASLRVNLRTYKTVPRQKDMVSDQLIYKVKNWTMQNIQAES